MMSIWRNIEQAIYSLDITVKKRWIVVKEERGVRQ